jgi:hypothetical protein
VIIWILAHIKTAITKDSTSFQFGILGCSGHVYPTELHNYCGRLLSSQSVVSYLRSLFNLMDPKETKTKDKESYQIARLSCNFAYTRSIKEDFGFQDPFGAPSESKK